MSDITRADIERMIEVAEKATPGDGEDWYGEEYFLSCDIHWVDAGYFAAFSPNRIIPILRLALKQLDAEKGTDNGTV